MPGLSELESVVLSALLDGPGRALAGLRRQLQFVQVTERERSGVGCFTSFDVGSAHAIDEQEALRLGDVIVDLEGVEDGVGFVLFVRNGRLSMLEAYTFGSEPWPEREKVVSLRYTKSPRNLPAQLMPPADS